jgi:hypothetical protein
VAALRAFAAAADGSDGFSQEALIVVLEVLMKIVTPLCRPSAVAFSVHLRCISCSIVGRSLHLLDVLGR